MKCDHFVVGQRPSWKVDGSWMSRHYSQLVYMDCSSTLRQPALCYFFRIFLIICMYDYLLLQSLARNRIFFFPYFLFVSPRNFLFVDSHNEICHFCPLTTLWSQDSNSQCSQTIILYASLYVEKLSLLCPNSYVCASSMDVCVYNYFRYGHLYFFKCGYALKPCDLRELKIKSFNF